jgi:ABC-type Mn2+/Zn2+ transport system permease subunit
MNWLTEPLTYEFMRNGVMVAVLAGLLCGAVGCYVLVRHLGAIGHGLSHSIFGGAAVSAVVGVNFFVGAGVSGAIASLLIGRLARGRRIGADASIAIVTTSIFALGLALVNRFGSAKRSVESVLFGSVLGVARTDVVVIGVVAVCVGAVIWTNYRALLFSTFDPQTAAVTRTVSRRTDAVLMLVLCATVLVSMRIVGALLISALLVIPAATARLLTSRFDTMMVMAPVIGALSGLLGMFVSYHADIAPGASIVLVAAATFLCSLVIQHRGLLRSPGSRRHIAG